MANVQSVIVYNDTFELMCEMKLADTDTSGFVITNCEGIEPGDASVILTELATDGSVYNHARKAAREITLTMVIEEGYTNVKKTDGTGAYTSDWLTIPEKRHLLYKLFPLYKKVTLVFNADDRCCMIDGYVAENNTAILTNLEYAQIKISCPFPWFTKVDTSTIEPTPTRSAPSQEYQHFQGELRKASLDYQPNVRFAVEPQGDAPAAPRFIFKSCYDYGKSSTSATTSGCFGIYQYDDSAFSNQTGYLNVNFDRLGTITRKYDGIYDKDIYYTIECEPGNHLVHFEDVNQSFGYNVIGCVDSLDDWPKPLSGRTYYDIYVDAKPYMLDKLFEVEAYIPINYQGV